MKKYRIAFFGSDCFAIFGFKALSGSDLFEIPLIVSQPPRKVGREGIFMPTEFAAYALSCGLDVVYGTFHDIQQFFLKMQLDIAVVIAYGSMIPSFLLHIPQKGFCNLHGSLLPKYRGATPIQSALLHGDQRTGLSLIQMSRRLDAGPLIDTLAVDILQNDTYESLSKRLSELSGHFLIQALDLYLSGHIRASNQNDSEATYCFSLKRSDGLIDWHSLTALEVIRMFRAYYPWPGIFTFFQHKRLKLIDIELQPLASQEPSGFVYQCPDGKIAVATKDGAVSLRTVQLEGGRIQTLHDFLNGFPSFIGTML